MDSLDPEAVDPDTDPAPAREADPHSLPLTSARRREAEEWALVLTAEGFEPEVVRCLEGFRVDVAPERIVAARGILSAWQQERTERARRLTPPPVRSATLFEVATAYALALMLLSYHLGLEFSDRYPALLEVGANRASLVLAGEPWRLVTALTLHSDLSHALGNTFFGGFFLVAVAGRLGIGLGLLTFVVTGTLGNLANDLYYGWDHLSIGASTGVFGLVGVLTGMAAWRRHQTAITGRGAWVAIGAGLGIVAMLGTGGPEVDVSAHLFGLIVGALAGLLLAIPLTSRPLPGPRGQTFAFAAALLLIIGAWHRALLVTAS
jgi:membrane associated rhomboid family serine protease